MALASHDPTRPAHKTQYASLVLTHDDTQSAVARAVVQRLESVLGRKLAARVEPVRRFYLAEAYHQKYYLRNDRTLMVDFRAMFDDDDAFRESTAAAHVNGYVAGDGPPSLLESDIERLGLSVSGRSHLESVVGRRSGTTNS